MSDDRDAEGGSLLRRLNVLVEDSKRRQEIEGWLKAIKAAEATAAGKPNAKRRLYQVNYRVAQTDSDEKGGSAGRREALTELLKSLAPVERHQSTSSWIVRLHVEQAIEVANLLTPPLDVKRDFLSVAELTANRAAFGDAKLKSR